ncbi:MAG: type II toxin-antitoxin system HicB family antitoxin [Thermomicrobiales bacterium]
MIEARQVAHYSMIMEWDVRDNIYVVTVPELPGCRTHGATREEAVKQGEEVIALWLESAREWGDPIPPPRYFDLGEIEAARPVGASSV